MPAGTSSHHRRSIRLDGYDYTQDGAYFVTLVTWQRECLFGEIGEGKMRLNNFGQIVQDEWKRTPCIRPEIELGEWVVMPNHFHGILAIRFSSMAKEVGIDPDGQQMQRLASPIPVRAPRSLGACIAGYKTAVTRRINEIRHTPGAPVFQRNYYEHIIRNEEEQVRIERYIHENPVRWDIDDENPTRPRR